MKKLSKFNIICLFLTFLIFFITSVSGVCAEKVINWRLQSVASAGDFTYQGALRFADLVNEASNGRLVIKPFTGGAIVPGGKEFEAAMNGSVEAIQINPSWGIGYLPIGYLFCGYPGGLTANQMMMWMDFEGRKMAQEVYEPLNLQFVGNLTYDPPEVWLHSTKPLKSVEDLKGLKVRLGDAAVSKIFEKMGATPVFFPGSEIYESAQRGIIDAFEYVTPTINWGMGFNEVAKYMYLSPSRCPLDNYSLFVNKKVWDALPSDLKAIVEASSKKVAHEFYAEIFILDIEATKKFEEYGVVVEKVPEDIENLLIEKSAEYFAEECAKDPTYKKIYDSAMEYKKYCEEFDVR